MKQTKALFFAVLYCAMLLTGAFVGVIGTSDVVLADSGGGNPPIKITIPEGDSNEDLTTAIVESEGDSIEDLTTVIVEPNDDPDISIWDILWLYYGLI